MGIPSEFVNRVLPAIALGRQGVVGGQPGANRAESPDRRRCGYIREVWRGLHRLSDAADRSYWQWLLLRLVIVSIVAALFFYAAAVARLFS